MKSKKSALLVFLLWLARLGLPGALDQGVATTAVAAEGGTIEGTVIYEADAKRPWRYGRYYIANAREGHLAEAVVALTGPNLKHAGDPAEPATAAMDQKDHRFIPETLAIRAGDAVKFTNSDPQLHNVHTLTFPHEFNATMGPGGEFVQTFARATATKRPVAIGCRLHSQMQAWIFVFDHPFFQVTESDGRFRLEDVPPGKYRLEMNHSAGGLWWTGDVEIQPGRTETLDIRVSPDHKG